MRIRFCCIIIALVFLNVLSFGQTELHKYRINFTDKDNSAYSLSHPEKFLSQRAIERKGKFNIPIDNSDIPISKAYKDSLYKLGISILHESKWFNFVTVLLENDSLIDRIQQFPFVEKVEYRGYLIKTKCNAHKNQIKLDSNHLIAKINKENKTANNSQSQTISYNFKYGEAENQIRMLKGDFLHKNGYAGEGKWIAVLDGGFYQVNNLNVFDSLWQHGRIIATKDFVNPFSDFYLGNSHGMKVLSIMGGNIENALIGTAPKASYLLLRTEEPGSETITEEDSWIAGAEFADSIGADIINSSLGYTVYDKANMSHSYSDMDGNTCDVTKGADMAVKKGMIVVNSAGNAGNESWLYIGAPADGDSVLAIGAVDENKNYASFSSIGPSADGRTKPDVSAQGFNTALASTTGEITYGSGTSFSAPVISGLIACLWQALPDYSNIKIIDLVRNSANQSDNPSDYLGYGIADFAKAYLTATNSSIPNIDESNKISILPNPFSNEITVRFLSNETTNIEISISDISGRAIYKELNMMKFEGYNNIRLNNIGFLAQGIYILKIKSQNHELSFKILKI